MALSNNTDPYHRHELEANHFPNAKEFTLNGIITQARILQISGYYAYQIGFYLMNVAIVDWFHLDKIYLLNRNIDFNFANNLVSRAVLNKIVWIKFSDNVGARPCNVQIFLIDTNSPEKFTGNEINLLTLLIANSKKLQIKNEHNSRLTLTLKRESDFSSTLKRELT